MFAEIVFPVPVDRSFHYGIPESLLPRTFVGSRVLAPFGRRNLTGFVVALSEKLPEGDFKVRDIREALDERPVFSQAFLDFSRKLSRHFFVSWGEILEAALPPALVIKEIRKVSLTEEGRKALEEGGLSKKEKALARLLLSGPRRPASLVKEMAVRSLTGILSRLEKKGFLVQRTALPGRRKRARAVEEAEARQMGLDLVRETGGSAAPVEKALSAGAPASFCLFGPADLRREVYAGLVRMTLAEGCRALLLAPEISLLGPLIDRLKTAGDAEFALIHSRQAPGKRMEEWNKLIEGDADIVAGSRSAALAPVENLRLIIVDEESDESYAQQEGQLFDVRESVRLRSEAEKAVSVFGSSCPSVETYHDALKRGSLIRIGEEKKKFAASLLDDRGEKTVFSAPLVDKIRGRLRRGDPVVVFVNRRGYAPLVFCPGCGYSPRCDRCDIGLSYHKKSGSWVCHYCNASVPASRNCPRCGKSLVQRRSRSIEAAEEELRSLFPGAKIAGFDSDAAGREKDRAEILDDFRRGRISVLLGTRFLAGRTDLPRVPLVGVLSPEALLASADYQAAEKVFQSIMRMREFAEDLPDSEFVIQTSSPSHYAVREAAAGDYRSFYEAEIESRRILDYPPFSHLAEIQLQGSELRTLAGKSREFAVLMKKFGEGIEIFGPALAAVSRVRGLYRIQVILKAADRTTLEKAVRETAENVSVRKTIRVV